MQTPPPVGGIRIVGAGITGSLVAYFLRTAFPRRGREVSIYEAGRVAGGRLAGARVGVKGEAVVDVGAQYVSFDSPAELTPRQREVVALLRDAGALRPVASSSIVGAPQAYLREQNYGAAAGCALSRCVDAVNAAGAPPHDLVHLSHRVSAQVGGVLGCEPAAEAAAETAAAAAPAAWVFAVPIPHFLRAVDGACAFDAGVRAKLEEATFSTRHAVCLAVEDAAVLDACGVGDGAYVYTSCSEVRFVSRRGRALVAHAAANAVDPSLDEEAGGRIVEEALYALYPSLRAAVAGTVLYHKWDPSQNYESPFRGAGFCCVNAGASASGAVPRVFVTGDAFAETSNILGCVEAAYKTAAALAALDLPSTL
eukprot:Rhum_TRINITY_DN11706_c0_g1::Rhum_TRINITY_DN11706_c0_g1_i1::g.46355::m.46355/K18208/RNLS; renalase